MGATGSSNRAPSPSPPSRGRNEEAFAYGAEESWCPEYANENIRQRTRANAFDVGEEPRSQVKYKTNIYRRWAVSPRFTRVLYNGYYFNSCRDRVLTRPSETKNGGVKDHRLRVCRTCDLLAEKLW